MNVPRFRGHPGVDLIVRLAEELVALGACCDLGNDAVASSG